MCRCGLSYSFNTFVIILGAKESDLLLSDELEWWKVGEEFIKFKVSVQRSHNVKLKLRC